MPLRVLFVAIECCRQTPSPSSAYFPARVRVDNNGHDNDDNHKNKRNDIQTMNRQQDRIHADDDRL